MIMDDLSLRIRWDIIESPGSARLPLYVIPGEGPLSTSCSAGLANDVDAGPSPGIVLSLREPKQSPPSLCTAMEIAAHAPGLALGSLRSSQ